MSRNLQSPSKLTEFAPLSPEPNQPGVGLFLSKIFKFNKGGNLPEAPGTGGGNGVSSDMLSPSLTAIPGPGATGNGAWQSTESLASLPSDAAPFRLDVNDGRSLPNVLKRISNLLALKSSGLQSYKDTDFKQYWMPDSVSKECYDCGERFTTFRRRHHCRVCGQIFCSRCCSQVITGKIMGCTGDLRVCTYCCKVVLSYLQSADIRADLSADLRSLQEDLQTKFGSAVSPSGSAGQPSLGGVPTEAGDGPGPHRRTSVGFQEDRFAGRGTPLSATQGPAPGPGQVGFLSAEERCRALQRSASLRALYEQLTQPGAGLALQTHRYRLRMYPGCFLGSELVDWLMTRGHAATRVQGVAISQALMDGGFLESIAEPVFTDGYALYRPCPVSALQSPQPSGPGSTVPSDNNSSSHDSQDPLWGLPQQDSLGTDSESECQASEENGDAFSLPSSSSTFYLDLNVEASTVTLSRPRAQEGNPTAAAPAPTPAHSPHSQPPPGEKPHDCCHTGISSEFLSGTRWLQEAPAAQPPVSPSAVADSEEQLERTRLQSAYQQHESGLLRQLLNAEALPQAWGEVILPLVTRAVEMVDTDVRMDSGVMDIRHYVQFKKVPGGVRTDSCLVRGLVCTKNVAHRAMAKHLVNPRILCVGCAIDRQRTEGRLMSLEPVLLQEREYLRNVVARIDGLRPSLVLVHRNVSRLAQELLLELGIVLVLNVRASVLERVARCTGADVVGNVDALIGRPQLGTCRAFYLQTFRSESGSSKTLMFFESCAHLQLGATVLLRGAALPELRRAKRAAQLLLFSRYSWRLELSFLMDEGARPPSPPRDPVLFQERNSPLLSTDTTSPPADQNFAVEGQETNSQISPNNCYQSESTEHTPVNKEKKGLLPPTPASAVSNTSSTCTVAANTAKDKSPAEDKRTPSKDKERSPTEERRTAAESVSDFSDPLRSYLTLEDEVFSLEPAPEAEPLPVAELPLSNRFRKALDGTILSASPYLQFTVPYLETEAGRSSALWKFFTHEVFWSAQFSDPGVSSSAVGSCAALDTDLQLHSQPKLQPQHPFVSAKLTSPADSREVQALLAHFRACGGRLPLPSPAPGPAAPAVVREPAPWSATGEQLVWLDALDPRSHQHLAVLFCSYAHESSNAPAFCVNPWVVHMDFYNSAIDIPLGGYLERYCFRPSYVCPSPTCDTRMLEHVRRFVHDAGCVHVLLRELERPIPGDNTAIYMWSWCSRCQAVSPVVPMGPDTWAFSFAKFLELRFHGHVYRRREGCTHSLHHDHLLYFAQKTIVASFKYTHITQWEVSLPPPLIALSAVPPQQGAVIEEIKKLALKGYEVFSCILERLCSLSIEMDMGALKQQLQKEQAHYKLRIEEIQLKLTSPTLEAKRLEGKVAERDVQRQMWHIEDDVVHVKRFIADTVEAWNTRLQDLAVRKRDERQRRSEGAGSGAVRTSLPPPSSLSLDTDEEPSAAEVASPGGSSDDDLASPVEPVAAVPLEEASGTPGPSAGDVLERTNNSSGNEGPTQSRTEVADCVVIQQNDVPEDVPVSVNASPRACAARSQQPSIAGPDTDSHDGKPAQKIVKTLLSQLLPSTGPIPPIQSPLSPQEHPLTTAGCTMPMVVYEAEPSSVVACALSSADYRRALEDMRRGPALDQASPSPVHKRRLAPSGGSDRELLAGAVTAAGTGGGSAGVRGSPTAGAAAGSEGDAGSRRTGVLSFLRGSSSSGGLGRPALLDGVQYSASAPLPATAPTLGEGVDSGDPDELLPTAGKGKGAPSPHIEVQFSDATGNFFCRVYYAEQFAVLRQAVLPCGEEAFVRSLARSVQWAARGGKSGSNFCKTKDDRFVLKDMSKLDLQLFLDFGPHYFAYMHSRLGACQPTLLGKIVGVYRIKIRNPATNLAQSSNLLVMENLFYQRCVTHKFDLKGSVRNRLVNPTAEHAGEIVLLDENLLKMTCDSPLYIYPHSKAVLMKAINSDTEFLASQAVMDYSLLVGLDQERKELVVGIIDYIRTFTWDKKLEAMVKYYGNLGGGQAKLPTVVSPELYRARFIDAMDRYFLPVPDRWTRLGRGLLESA